MSGSILTADEMAERFKVPVSQIYRLARSGQLPSIKLGRYVRFRLADIEAFERSERGAAR